MTARRPAIWCQTEDCRNRTPVGWYRLAAVIAAGWTCPEHTPHTNPRHITRNGATK